MSKAESIGEKVGAEAGGSELRARHYLIQHISPALNFQPF